MKLWNTSNEKNWKSIEEIVDLTGDREEIVDTKVDLIVESSDEDNNLYCSYYHQIW